jgi:hypothetical protein
VDYPFDEAPHMTRQVQCNLVIHATLPKPDTKTYII